MNKTALVIMAAGMGSRYGGGIKQLEKVGPSGEIIMDYSIHDAKAAGFDRVVFITRKDLEKDFREIIGNRVEKKIKTDMIIRRRKTMANPIAAEIFSNTMHWMLKLQNFLTTILGRIYNMTSFSH